MPEPEKLASLFQGREKKFINIFSLIALLLAKIE